ncbi:hypothetical protein MMC13_001267 [Lambiella insularis]|nr:hypothetical protein [Lambiella insularis]
MAEAQQTNGIHTNGDSQAGAAAPAPLKVIIIGGGIGGLTAAIALRQQGHDVDVYEQSRFANEVGAAINMVPNAVGVLRRLGVHVEDEGAVLLKQTSFYKHTGELISTNDNTKYADRWQNPFFLAHRAHLHKHLKDVAMSPKGKGRPVPVHTSCKLTDVDAQTGTVTFQSGHQVQGDLVIGADGVQSVTRAAVGKNQAYKSNHSAMRFLLPRESALAHPVTHDLATVMNSMEMWYSSDRKVVVYPCVNNTLLNFVCVHPAHLSDTSDDYNQRAPKAQLLDIYREFEPRIFTMLEMADPESLKVYPLFDLETLPSFIKDRVALIGDAAHPFTPHLGQGGAMAIEDGVSLGVMMPLGVRPDEVPQRLELYNKARYERGTMIQNYSRIVGGDGISDKERREGQFRVHEYFDAAFSHDEFHASEQILREYLWHQKDRNLYWRQPTVFGPMPGPRQDVLGRPRTDTLAASSSLKASIKFKTSATLLRTLFPNPSYRFAKPDTIAQATFSVQSLTNLDWLAGGGYEVLGLHIHGVQYTTQDGEVLNGSYCPVMFENLPDPILSGREELGFPKVYSDIQITEDESTGTYGARISWRGAEWASFEWQGLRKQEAQDSNGTDSADATTPHDESVFVHKCIPASGSAQRAKSSVDAEYDVFHPYPASTSAGTDSKPARHTTEASFKIHDLDVKRLPTLHHIVSRLAEIPVFGIVEATVTEKKGVNDFSNARRI